MTNAIDQRLKRLKNDHERLVAALEENDFIKIVESLGTPPNQYTIAFNFRGMTYDVAAREPSNSTHHQVEITLFKEYPSSPPYCRMKTEIFHPNMNASEIWVGDESTWSASQTLLDVVKQIARMTAYQEYDLSAPMNEEAAEWAKKNEAQLPLDPTDFFAHDITESELERQLEEEPQAKAFCSYCLEPDPKNVCSNGHPACDDCLSTCRHCDEITCLACPDNTCKKGRERVEAYCSEIDAAVSQGSIDQAEAVARNAVETFAGVPRLTETLKKIEKIRRHLDHIEGFRKSSCFHGIVTTCKELRSVGFENQTLAELEGEASDKLREADALVTAGKKEIDGGSLELACKQFSDALGMVPDHPSAYKLLKKAKARVEKANELIESAQEHFDKGEYDLAIFDAKKALSLDSRVGSTATGLIDTASHLRSSKQRRKKGRLFALLAAGGALILAAIIFFFLVEDRRLKAEYDLFLQEVETIPFEEGKVELLQVYIITHGRSRFTKDAEKRIKGLRAVIDERQFEMAKRNASIMLTKEDYEKAEAVYDEYLAQNPDTVYATELNKNITEIHSLIDDKDYETLLWLSNNNPKTRIGAYKSYLENHPDGKHRKEVKKLIQDLGKPYYEHFKQEVAVLKANDDWGKCIEVCDEFDRNIGKSQWAEEVDEIRTECRSALGQKKDLAALVAEADTKGSDYEAAKQVYLRYLKDNPDSSLRTEIEDRVDVLDQNIRSEKEWDEVIAFVTSEKNDLDERISRLKEYVAQNASGRHSEEAAQALEDLEANRDTIVWKQVVATCRDPRATVERKMALLQSFVRNNTSGKHLSDAKAKIKTLEDEQAKAAWMDIARYANDQRISMPDRINRLTLYINQNPSGKYVGNARLALHKLRRFQTEEQAIRRLVLQASSTYVYRDGIITDKRTGLMWCAFDSYLDLQRCLKYESATQYVKTINFGGYSDWRIPSEAAVRLIYKNKPFFPTASDGEWYWTSNLGSGGMVPVVMSDREIGSGSAKIEADIGCGSVRGVRGP